MLLTSKREKKRHNEPDTHGRCSRTSQHDMDDSQGRQFGFCVIHEDLRYVAVIVMGSDVSRSGMR